MPADFREEYFPVYYVEPYQGNEAALGFDLASNPVRLEALNKSRDSGQGVATARITLVQESEDQFGFLVFRPIYRNGFPAETMAVRLLVCPNIKVSKIKLNPSKFTHNSGVLRVAGG